MSFLPIVERELRVAARRRSTHRVRWWVTVLGFVFCFIYLVIESTSSGRAAGSPVFSILTGYAFVVCILSGVLLTSTALAEENSAGTLGLLFLTDLRSHDIVLGKFAAHSLNAFYALFALLPVTALPFLIGGVQGGEFWRMALALLNALFFSLATGLFVSSFMREPQRAMGDALGLLVLLVVVPPVFAAVSPSLKAPPASLLFAWLSPFYCFAYSPALYAISPGGYWGSLAISHLFAWGLLVAAAALLPRAIQDRSRPTGRPKMPLRRQSKPRSRLLAQNPVLWLTAQELGYQRLAWLVVVVWAVATISLVCTGVDTSMPVIVSETARPFGFLLKLLIAVQVCRFFVEARRTGSFELLLTTPLTNQQIVDGQVNAVWRAFGGPLIAFGVLLFFPLSLRVVLALFNDGWLALPASLGGAFLSVGCGLRMVADLFAIMWFGMGLALTTKRPNLAPALTVIFVLVFRRSFRSAFSISWWI